jgi:hypothetical protein
LEKHFANFEGLNISLSHEINEIIEHNKNKLLNQFDNISEVTLESISAVRSFSALLDMDLERKVIKIIEIRFN